LRWLEVISALRYEGITVNIRRVLPRIVLPTAFCLLCAAGFAPQFAGGQAPGTPSLILPGDSVQVEIAADQVRKFCFVAAAGQLFRFQFGAVPAAIRFKVVSPAGNGPEYELARGHIATGKTGFALDVTEAPGTHCLEARLENPKAGPVTFRLHFEILRPATQKEVQVAAARRLCEKGYPALSGPYSMAGLREAVQTFEAAVPLFRAAEDRIGEALALRDIGQTYYRLGEGPTALEYYRRSLAIMIDLGERVEALPTLRLIHLVCTEIGEYQQTLEAELRALQFYREIQDPRGETDVLGILSRTYRDLGDLQQALDCLELVRSFRHSVGEREAENQQLYYIGSIHEMLGDRQKALECFLRLADFWEQEGRPDQRSNCLVDVARMQILLDEYGKAQENLEDVLSFEQSTHSSFGIARAFLLLGSLHSKLGGREKSVAYLDQAQSTFSEAKNLYYRANFMFLEVSGNTYLDNGEAGKALSCYAKGLAIARANGNRANERLFLCRVAAAEKALGKLEDARTHAEEALALGESMRTVLESPGERASIFAGFQPVYELYVSLLLDLHARRPGEGFDALALQASERARSRSLLELLDEARAEIHKDADKGLLEKERSLRQRLNAKATLLETLKNQKNTAAEDVAREIRSLVSQYDRVEAQIRTDSPRYATMAQSSPLDLAGIRQRVLDPDTLLLEYLLGQERSYVWAVTDKTLAVFELPGKTELEAAARRLYVLLSARSEPAPSENLQEKRSRLERLEIELPAVAARLSRMVLGPAASLLQGRRLLIVADGALQYIPFAVLPDPATPGQPLVVRHEIVHAPSASVLAASRAQTAGRAPAAKAVAVLADPVFDADDPRVTNRPRPKAAPVSTTPTLLRNPGLERSLRSAGIEAAAEHLPRLPFSRREAEAIIATAPAKQGLMAVDFQASRATAFSPELSRYRIVHFATHSLLNSTDPALSGIVLSLVDERGIAQDGFLRLQDTFNLNVPVDLIVLSACRTALGKEVRGEGLIGLTRGFMYAGAARILASLWKVDDEATQQLMASFYRGVLREHLEPAAALRRAQLQMLRQRDWQSPFYWGAFVLQGEWHAK